MGRTNRGRLATVVSSPTYENILPPLITSALATGNPASTCCTLRTVNGNRQHCLAVIVFCVLACKRDIDRWIDQVDNFLNEERASIDEYDQYLTERSALADRTKAQAKAANAEKAGARNRGDDASAA